MYYTENYGTLIFHGKTMVLYWLWRTILHIEWRHLTNDVKISNKMLNGEWVSQYSVIVSFKYLNLFYIYATSTTCIYFVFYIFWVALLFPNVSIIPWTCNHNSPICTSKHVFQDFYLSIIITDDQIKLCKLIECFHRLFM